MRIIIRAAPYVMRQPVNAIPCTFLFSARIAIGYKSSFKQGVHIVKQQVVHYPVTKSGSKYFAILGLFHNKTSASAHTVLSFIQFVAQLYQFLFHTHFKAQLVMRVPLMPASIIIRRTQIGKQTIFVKNERRRAYGMGT